MIECFCQVVEKVSLVLIKNLISSNNLIHIHTQVLSILFWLNEY